MGVKLIKEVLFYLSPRKRLELCFIFILMIIASLFELISIGSVYPFIQAIVSPGSLGGNKYVALYLSSFQFNQNVDLMLLITLIFGLLIFFASLIRIGLLWLNTSISYSLGTEISSLSFRYCLYENYDIHASRNSVEIIKEVSMRATNVILTINSFLTLLSSSVILLLILAGLLFLSPKIAIISFLIFSIAYVTLIFFIKKKLYSNSQIIDKQSSSFLKVVQQSLGGIKEIIISHSQEFFYQKFLESDTNLRRTLGVNQFIAHSPKYFMEGFGILVIIFLAYYLSAVKGSANTLPFLGVIAISAQRILPLFQQIYSSWSNIQGGKASLFETIKQLKNSEDNYFKRYSIKKKKIVFCRSIKFNKVSYCYIKGKDFVLDGASFKIRKGQKVFIVGKSGAGKSTLVNLLLGIIKPTSGEILVDNHILNDHVIECWQKNLAYVSQQPFLLNDTIAANIAFGMNDKDIDFGRLNEAIIKAELTDFVDSKTSGINFLVGENGVNLSGGQRQRVAIARALYKNVSLLIFDEATSSLDVKTEKEILNTILNLGNSITVIIITHRISAIDKNHKVFYLKNGLVDEITSADEILHFI